MLTTSDAKSVPMTGKRALIGLGSNMGDSASVIRAAIKRVAATDGIEVVATSSLYESEPAYREAQEMFCNAIVELRTKLGPHELLKALQGIEAELGRIRAEVNGPRVIDLDIIDYEVVVSDDPELLLPHPLALERDFIVTPLLEIAPGYMLADGEPVTHETVAVGKILASDNAKDIQKSEQNNIRHPGLDPGSKQALSYNDGRDTNDAHTEIPHKTRKTAATRELGSLSICATPIGNLGDITQRVVQALAQADVVLAEDTRVARRLLSHLNLRARIERCDENTIRQNAPGIIMRIQQGMRFAFISDAGMPGIADPGAYLVDATRKADCLVEVLPGASAVTTAVAASGFTTPAFLFGGFLPRKQSQITKLLEQLADLDALLVFFESPHRAIASLKVFATVFPQREVALARELTKLHEEILRAPVAQLVQQLKEREAQGQSLKGEIVLVVEAPKRATRAHTHHDRYAEKQREDRQAEDMREA